MLPPAQAPVAVAAAEHGVADDPAADPRRVHAVTHGGDDAAPLVPDPHRIPGLARVEVVHRAGEELRVGAAHPGALDLDDHLARARDGRFHVLDGRLAGPGDDERSHGPMVADSGEPGSRARCEVV